MLQRDTTNILRLRFDAIDERYFWTLINLHSIRFMIIENDIASIDRHLFNSHSAIYIYVCCARYIIALIYRKAQFNVSN
jgi:hypothetical protein